jgi:NADPH:quinone reductase-like Zn-dependent oxidoreductase
VVGAGLAREEVRDVRVVLLEAFNAPLRISERGLPVARPDQVLVRVEASGVNALDIEIRDGRAPQARVNPPAVLGLDLAGVVVLTGRDVPGFRAGDEVYGLTGGVADLPGSLAEFAAVDARLLALKPSAVSMREAAAMPLAVLTAWEGLVDRAGVHHGQRVLVHGGAGGVGHLAVQLARAFGAEVFATGAPRSLATIESLGAVPIDYTTTPVEEYVGRCTGGDGFDIVLDTIGGPTLDASFAAVRAHTGHVVSTRGWGSHSLTPLSRRAATFSGVFTLLPLLTGIGRARHGRILRAVAALADSGALRPVLDPRRFGLEGTADAHEQVENGTSDGKVVIEHAHGSAP